VSFHDHHIHPLGYAGLVNGLELMGLGSLDEVLEKVVDRAAATEGAVIGQRLNDEGLAEARLPTRHDLDSVIPDRPVLLYRYCGHIAVANTRTLEMSGVDAGTPDPDGGSIDRGVDGEPTGVLRETAVTLVSRALAPIVNGPSDGEILEAMARLPAMGLGSITGIVSAGEPLWCGVPDELGTLCRLAPDLPLDMEVLVAADNASVLADAADQIRRSEGRLRFLGWKEFADGSFGGHTASMHQPYTDRPDTMGTDRLRLDHTIEMARTSILLGGSVAIHAIGDRAIDSVLDVYEELIAMGAEPARLRIEHVSIPTAEAIQRMADLGVTASVQPAFVASEGEWLAKRLGDDRMERAYPFRSMMQAGIPLIGGSDSPVELPDPEVGITAAVERPGFNPSERLDRAQAEGLFSAPSRN
jgi:predicted amidohydrolase YtcJ